MILAALLLARDLLARWDQVRVRRALTAAGALFLAAAAFLDARCASRFGLLSMSEGETLYRHASQWAQRAIPGRSIVLCMQMSGALTYYAHLPIARWDRITPETFPRIRDAVRERGFAWYALLRDFEQKELAAQAPGNWTKIGAIRDVILWRLD
jgi:hypothetical protein